MPDVPTSYDDLNYAKSVELFMNPTEVATADALNPDAMVTKPVAVDSDKLVSLTGIDVNETLPERRTNMGFTRIYTHGAPDITVSFSAVASNDLATWLNSRFRFNATSKEVEVYTWLFRAENMSGESSDYAFRAKMIQKAAHKGAFEQEDPVTVDATLRVIDFNPSVTDVSVTGTFRVTGATLTNSNQRVNIAFNDAVDTTTVAASDFRIRSTESTVPTATIGAIRGSVVPLELSRAVTTGETLTIIVSGINSDDGIAIGGGRTVTVTGR